MTCSIYGTGWTSFENSSPTAWTLKSPPVKEIAEEDRLEVKTSHSHIVQEEAGPTPQTIWEPSTC